MTEKFPKLRRGQVALSRADTKTGIVLDESCNYALNEGQKVYTIYESLSQALEAAKAIVIKRNGIECYIHRSEEDLLYFFDHTKVNDII